MPRLRTLVVTDKPAQVRRLISECTVLGCPCSLNWASSQKGLLPLSFGEGQIRPQLLTRFLLEQAELIVILPPSRDGEKISQLRHGLKACVVSGQYSDSLPCQLGLEAGSARQFQLPLPEAWMIATALQPLLQRKLITQIEIQTKRQAENLKLTPELVSQRLWSQLALFMPGDVIHVKNIQLQPGDPYVEAQLDFLLNQTIKAGELCALLQDPDHSVLLPAEKTLDYHQAASQETRILIDQIQSGQNDKQWHLRLISDPQQACLIAASARQITVAARLTLKNS